MEVSPLTLNRVSLYLRCLRRLQEMGIRRISSHELAKRFELSAAQIRKDLAHFGEFGIRGVGYEVDVLAQHLTTILGLDRKNHLVVVGMGGLGSALARYLQFKYASFSVAALFDNDPQKVGREIGGLIVCHVNAMEEKVRETGARIGILTVPAKAAEGAYRTMIKAGIQAVLNYAPARLPELPGVRTKNVDFRVHLEELVYYLQP